MAKISLIITFQSKHFLLRLVGGTKHAKAKITYSFSVTVWSLQFITEVFIS